VQSREHLALLHMLTLFDMKLSERARDLCRYRRLPPRGDITSRLQNRRRTRVCRRGHRGGLIDLEGRLAHQEVVTGSAGAAQQKQRDQRSDDPAGATRVALSVLLTLAALDA